TEQSATAYYLPLQVPLQFTCKKLYKLLRKDNLTRHHFFAWYDNVLNACLKQREITIPRPKDKAHTSHSMDLPMELRYMIPHLALQFNTENPCRPAD
ncbi:hypothetical protein D6C92_02327, partial [Aureobasidium pullulans]